MGRNIHILKDATELASAAARRVVDLAERAVAEHGAFHLALAGGSTPQGLYHVLARPEFSEKIPWEKVRVYFGDERNVPPDHADSNYRMARKSLLEHVPIPAEQIFRMHGEDPPEEAAAAYAQVLKRELPADGNGWPQFDLVLLGMGPDGHTASLFPNTDILDSREHAVDAVHVPKLDTWRISLTFPTINAARHVAILVSGEKKADVTRHVLCHTPGAAPLPIQMVRPSGPVEWYLDADAAMHLQGDTPQ
jgi:6-phosphogluconolactonase